MHRAGQSKVEESFHEKYSVAGANHQLRTAGYLNFDIFCKCDMSHVYSVWADLKWFMARWSMDSPESDAVFHHVQTD